MPRKKKMEKYNEEDERTLTEDILDFVKVFAISAIVILLFVNFIAHPIQVFGNSMYPTLAPGEYGFTSIISNYFSKPERGEVVVITRDENTDQESHWVKRVIGLPGETVEARDGTVYINGEPLDESAYLSQEYIDETLKDFQEENGFSYGSFTSDFGPVTLGENEYWLMGDNRPYSKDSRFEDVGPISGDDIYGQGIMVFFPFNKAGVH